MNQPTPHALDGDALDEQTQAFANKVFELARRGDTEPLAQLLEQGLPANLRNHKGDSLLMLASYHGHLATVQLLLNHQADPQLANDNGQTPLAGAAFKGDLSMLQLLLEHGVPADGAMTDGKTPLMMAAMFNKLEAFDLLLAHGANPAQRDATGLSALSLAQSMGAQRVVERLQALNSPSPA